MNAVIALCTFCEVHGPQVVFTTQTYRNCFGSESTENLKFYGPKDVLRQNETQRQPQPDDNQRNCDGCKSLGSVKYLSNEHETRTSFLSAQSPLTQEIGSLLKYACIRSLSCEVHPGKEGICYFGDDYRGHVLSQTFTLKDAQARGFKRWCSFIVFMRDKQFLLNMWPFLVDNLRELIRELQDISEKKYNTDEAECPQRAARLTTASSGSEANSNKHPRSLSDITNEKHVFARIHMWLVWILSAGARHFIEILPMNLLDDELSFDLEHHVETEEGFTLVNARSPIIPKLTLEEPKIAPEFSEISHKSPISILKGLRLVLGKDHFRQILYSSLTGIQVLVRGPRAQILELLFGLSYLVPAACRRVVTQATEYMGPNLCNFIGVDTSVPVPHPNPNICRLDIVPNEHRIENTDTHMIRWAGTLPTKLPTLLVKIEKSFDNDKLGEPVLRANLVALQEEWANIAKVVHAMRGRGHRGDLAGLMMSLGAGPHDQKLLDAWSMGFPSNPA
ncbi:folliculin [Athalia rosae]|uniref:folliculin n=1 Tax=Athalia rosae TaxID=37344 RepID=UPI0020348DCB|nr:folliculin [Athalia rosae]